MLARIRVPAVFFSMAVLAVFAIACNGDTAGDGDPTATTTDATATALPLETPTEAAGLDIREESLDEQPGLSEYLIASGGVVDENSVLYADLTGSGAEEAVVPVSSGGEGGDIAVFVFGYIDGEVTELLRAEPEETSIVAAIEDGQLVTTEGAFAPGDPLNFPSQLLHRYYTWDGQALVVEREEMESAR